MRLPAAITACTACGADSGACAVPSRSRRARAPAVVVSGALVPALADGAVPPAYAEPASASTGCQQAARTDTAIAAPRRMASDERPVNANLSLSAPAGLAAGLARKEIALRRTRAAIRPGRWRGLPWVPRSRDARAHPRLGCLALRARQGSARRGPLPAR